MHKIFSMPFAKVYPHYVTKVERKGRTVAELGDVIQWLTGYTNADVQRILAEEVTFTDFFAQAHLNSRAELITGTICGVKIAEIEDPLMKQIRYLDKLVDELAQGRPLEKILR